MRFVVIDFETFFSDDFTLSKLSTEAYCRDARFEAHGAAIKWGLQYAAKWYDERQLRQVLKDEDWSDACIIAHHAHFDGLILTHHYGVRPLLWGCTLSMARLLLGNHLSVSLDSVREHFNMPLKRTPYHLFKGKHWSEIPPEHQQLIAEGACDEAESIWRIFGLLAKEFPAEEYTTVDLTVRMFVDPCLLADVGLLAQIWEKEAKEKGERLAALAIDTDQLQSADKFAALLRAEGVEPAKKPGKPNADGSEKLIYAFAKTDPFMEELLEDEDPRLRGLAEARLGAKSTLLQTRAETLGWMARRGPLCVYLRMYGAHTTRWSGGDSCLTADTQVLIFDWQKGLTKKRIVDILADDLIWDGEEFVSHGQVVFCGYQEVIEHDGIEGTPEHVVFTSRGEISLARAAETRTRILDCEYPHSWQVDATARSQRDARMVPVSMRKRKRGAVQRAKKR